MSLFPIIDQFIPVFWSGQSSTSFQVRFLDFIDIFSCTFDHHFSLCAWHLWLEMVLTTSSLVCRHIDWQQFLHTLTNFNTTEVLTIICLHFVVNILAFGQAEQFRILCVHMDICCTQTSGASLGCWHFKVWGLLRKGFKIWVAVALMSEEVVHTFCFAQLCGCSCRIECTHVLCNYILAPINVR